MSSVIPGGNRLINCSFFVDDTHNYDLGGNLNSAFAVGNIGDEQDFYLMGCYPDASSPLSPLITGNILDSEGNFLFRIVRNELLINPGNCSRVTGGFLGFEIVDSAGHRIMKVSTEFNEAGVAITTIEGAFFNRQGVLVCHSVAEGSNPVFEWGGTGAVFGINRSGGLGIVSDVDAAGIEIVRAAVLTGGSIYRMITGNKSNEDLYMDGTIFRDATITNCRLTVIRGDFVLQGECVFRDSQFDFQGLAGNVFQLARHIGGQ